MYVNKKCTVSYVYLHISKRVTNELQNLYILISMHGRKVVKEGHKFNVDKIELVNEL